MLRKKRILALTGALLISACVFAAPVKVFASGAASSSAGQELLPKTISVDVRNADVRDVLSAVAISMNKNIVYKGGEQKITLKLADMPSMTAFDYILRLIGMTYVQEGNTLIVSTRDVLTEDFSRRIALTSFQLKYITGAALTQRIQQLNLPVTVISMEENEKTLWVQGFPADIAKVRELINILDIQANGTGEEADASDPNAKTLSYVKLKYIDPYDFNLFLRTLGIEYGLAVSDEGDRLWLYANSDERKIVSNLKSKVDREDPDINMNDLNSFSVITVRNISKKTAVDAIASVYPALKVISVDNSAKSFFVSGTSEDISRARKLIADLDKVNDANISRTFFAYDLAHITAAEADRRLSGITFGDSVQWYTSTHPEFAKNIFIYCNTDYEEQLRELLQRIDEAPIETYNMPIYIGAPSEIGIYKNYLVTMLSLDSDGIFGEFNLGPGKNILYLKTPRADIVMLAEQMLERLSVIMSGDATVGDVSWSAYEAAMGGATIPKTDETIKAYGYWVLGKTGTSSGVTGFSGITGFSMTSQQAFSQDLPEQDPQEYLLDMSLQIDEFLRSSFIAGSETAMSDVINALKTEFESEIIIRDEKLITHTLPTNDKNGTLEFSFIIEAADGAWRKHKVSLTLPAKRTD